MRAVRSVQWDAECLEDRMGKRGCPDREPFGQRPEKVKSEECSRQREQEGERHSWDV